MNRTHKYTVRGGGQFPLDMLRYDSCWPATPEDVRNIRADRHDYVGERSVTLVSAGAHAPTAGRWKSYGWSVQ